MSLHQNTYGSADNGVQFDGAELSRLESAEMSRIGMPAGIIPRHRACHFARMLAYMSKTLPILFEFPALFQICSLEAGTRQGITHIFGQKCLMQVEKIAASRFKYEI